MNNKKRIKCSKEESLEKEKLDYIDRILIDYMDRQAVDYAYLITGNWGCGKTFYCNNILQNHLRSFCESTEEKKYVVNLSLFGRKTLGNIFSEITIRVIGMEKGYNLIDRFNIDEAITVVGDVSNKSWVSSVFSYFGKIINKNLPDIVQGIDNLDLKKQVLIVFDDLERCGVSDLKYLIGRIQTDFIDNGYHVLFVANENEIKWKDFFKWKEKFIRTTICFSKPPSSIITQLLEVKDDGPIKKLYSSNKSRFLSLINLLSKINNIRTWMFAFDIYDKVLVDAKIPKTNPYLHNLFLIIVLSCYYNTIDRSLFTNEISFLADDDKTPTIGRVVRKDFNLLCEELPGLHRREWTLESRLHSTEYVYVKMNSIIALIQQGYLDIHLFYDEFETSFPWGSEFEIAYSQINEFLCLNEEEFKCNIETMMQGVIRRKYKLYQYINIAVVMEQLEANGYFALVNCADYRQRIIDALDSIDISTIRGDSSYLKHQYDVSPGYIKPSIQRIIKEVDSFDDKKESFFTFFRELKKNGRFDYQSGLSEVFFEYVEKYKLACEFISFSGKALKAVDCYVFSFTKYDNLGRHYESRILPMKYLHTEIDSYLSSTNDKSKHFYDLKYFNGLLSGAIKKLESSVDSEMR